MDVTLGRTDVYFIRGVEVGTGDIEQSPEAREDGPYGYLQEAG